MTAKYPKWTWKEGIVSPEQPHIELRYSKGEHDSVLIALLSPPTKWVFTVQFLPTAASPGLDPAFIRNEVCKELDYFLIELGERDPWAYAKYHCGTASNLYSTVHWSFIAGRDSERGSVSKRLARSKRRGKSL